MALSELDDLLNDLEKTVEEERGLGKCTGARSRNNDLGISESNTYAQNNTSHLSPNEVEVTEQTKSKGSNTWTSANKNQDFTSIPNQISPVGSTMSAAAVSSPGPGVQMGVRQNLNELDVLLEDLSKARFSDQVIEQRTEMVSSSSSFTETSTKLGLGISHPKSPHGIGRSDTSDSVIREMQQSSMSERRSVTETNQQKGFAKLTNGDMNGHRVTPPPPPTRQFSPLTQSSTNKTTSITSMKSQRSTTSNDRFGASSATTELDDLMTQLDDLKLPSGPGEEPVNTNLDNMMINLQENLDKQGIRTKPKGVCDVCQKPIVGQVITALGKTFMPQCFVCRSCNQELGTKNFFERDGFAYCEMCYHLQFSPRCAKCDQPILDKCVSALGKTWHPECFVCCNGGCDFGDEGYHEIDGKAYCQRCHAEAYAPRCGGCSCPIIDNYISALDKQWCPACFVCAECREPFVDGNFFVHDDKPYCETHYHALRGSLCAGCGKPISGRCITAMFRKFHPEHFVCSFCLKQLNKGTFKEQGEKPYCHGCYDRLFG